MIDDTRSSYPRDATVDTSGPFSSLFVEEFIQQAKSDVCMEVILMEAGHVLCRFKASGRGYVFSSWVSFVDKVNLLVADNLLGRG